MQKNSVNKVIIVGNLGQDPEARFTPQGTAVTNLSVATNESWKNQSGEITRQNRMASCCYVWENGRNSKRVYEKRSNGLC